MEIVKWNPSFISNVESFFDDYFKSQFPALNGKKNAAFGESVPAVNIKEIGNEYIVELVAPGMDKKDFNISVENGVMIISAKKEKENEREEDGYIRKEFGYYSFKRSFSLPESAEDGKITAKYADGILHLRLPKKSEKKSHPALKVKVS